MIKTKKSYFTISVLTKPYLKKYFHTKYGNPIIFSTENYFGICLAGLLQRPVRIHKKKDFLRMRVDKFTELMDILCPISFLTNDVLGTYISDSHTISLNKLFEEKFEEELTFFSTVLNICGVETKDAIEEFCKNYNIEVGSDISFEALKKKEYRFRKNLENNPAHVSPKNKLIIQHTLPFKINHTS